MEILNLKSDISISQNTDLLFSTGTRWKPDNIDYYTAFT